jgi:hypothetical protein
MADMQLGIQRCTVVELEIYEIAVVFKSTDGEPPAKRYIRDNLYIPVRDRRFTIHPD